MTSTAVIFFLFFILYFLVRRSFEPSVSEYLALSTYTAKRYAQYKFFVVCNLLLDLLTRIYDVSATEPFLVVASTVVIHRGTINAQRILLKEI